MNKVISIYILLITISLLTSCDEDPVKEDTPELITKVTLTFTPTGGGDVVVVTANDPDGEGVQNITVDGPINLVINKSYTLSIELINGLALPTDPEYNITEEIEEEKDEHMFFFAWTNNVFADPAGNGNIDNRSDAVNYNDEDTNGLPLGLSTDWTTATSAASGTFRVMLKHQPDLKSATSSSSAGETDLDITFDISVN
ncbi:MAG: hypothetical protein JNM57_01490 [Cyclobacteriaceae bacterium]|nr:hypothetical protein [Cyclobacteriaceae bacterium]